MSEPETFSELRELARALPKNVLVPAYHIHSLLDETERLVERIADLERQLAATKAELGRTEALIDMVSMVQEQWRAMQEEARKPK